MFGVISSLVSGVVKPVVGYFQNKQALAAQTQANKLKYLQAVGDRKAALVSQGQAETATWELDAMQDGEKYRGFELYVLSMPLILCFTPYSHIVKAGFAAIEKTPGWYQFLVVTVFLANYGIRYGKQVARFMRRKIASP